MAQTITTKVPENVCRLATGRYHDDGTVAAYTFSGLGFQPRYVVVLNETGDEYCWIEGMAAGTSHKRIAAGTGAATATLGITVTSRGFTMGLDTAINVSDEQVTWYALG
jgi:hypothetical protein